MCSDILVYELDGYYREYILGIYIYIYIYIYI